MTLRELSSRWLDDAALFPPGDLPLELAVPAHREHRSSWYAPLVGPFVVAPRHLSAVGTFVDRSSPERLDISLVCWPDELNSLDVPEGLQVTAVELALTGDDGDLTALIRLATSARQVLGPQVVIYAERPWTADPVDAAARAAGAGVGVKLRTGGLSAEAFPSVELLARAVRACVAVGAAFKCTAGLHRGVRHTDVLTGLTHHGFLNVLLAAAAARAGEGEAELSRLLGLTDEATVARLCGTSDVLEARESFRSFGTCSVTEPVEDLARFGLLAGDAGLTSGVSA